MWHITKIAYLAGCLFAMCNYSNLILKTIPAFIQSEITFVVLTLRNYGQTDIDFNIKRGVTGEGMEESPPGLPDAPRTTLATLVPCPA